MAFKPFKILKGLLIKEENTNSPKQIEITPGGTAGTKTTVLSSQTTDKTLTLPDATDTLVGKATTDVLTNKSIDADTNTITNIENADIKAAAAIDATKIADGSVDNSEFQQISGLTSPAVGSTQAQTLTNKTIVVSANTITTASSGNLTSTELNSALAELQSDIDGRANRNLGNLTSPTAINQTLAPATHNAISVGTSNEKFSNLWIDDSVKSNRYDVVASGAGSATATGSVRAYGTGPDGSAVGAAVSNLGTSRAGVVTNEDSSVDAVATGSILVGTGNKTAGTGDSGSIKIRPGTSAGGTRGKILLEDSSLSGASTGHVWTLTNTTTGAGNWQAPPAAPATPTVQRFTSGSGTYTTAVGARYIKVRMVGGGGGGAGSANSAANGGAGGSGGNSTWNSTLLVAGGGTGGTPAGGTGIGGPGGTTSSTAGPAIVVSATGSGGGGISVGAIFGPSGAPSVFGGGGVGGSAGVAGGAGGTNTGGGGGGAGAPSGGGTVYSGASGGSGGYIEAIISAPASSYSYAVGAGSSGGTAGTSGFAGGAGGSGIIIVEEYY